ncbi:MAG TPA: hypothetical protein VIN08_02610 [Ohtaekwangia sp.]|uniref:hypothetical protein n=1 Tax=Ohtaekwangia sp. TaxID=2066019 RepID=UPI002F93875B
MHRISTLVVFAVLFSACTSSQEPKATVSFYYWKTIFKLTDAEKEVLKDNQVDRLYIRYFDIALDEGKAIPMSPVVFDEHPQSSAIVPVVYIRNAVMLQPALDVADLATKTVDYINQINEKLAIPCQEIQIDCDWTLTSRETYFSYIEAVKKRWGKKLSATIRLHQVKYYQKAGIPPVDRGVLMYYNMGRITADSSNSIYDRETAHRYIRSLRGYPLALDVALPVFSWGIHVRNNTVIGLLNKVDDTTFGHDAHFNKKASPFFEVRENVIKIGHYFQRGDRIKIESIQPDDLQQMADDLSEEMTQQPHEIIFYDLDYFNLKNYEKEKQFFQKISHAF